MATSEKTTEAKTKAPIYSLILEEKNQSEPLSSLGLFDVSCGFAAFTGFHGIPNIYNARGRVKKIFWALITLGMTALCVNNVVANVQDLLEYNVNINVDIKTASELVMPAVTFCNLNAFRLSVIPDDVKGPLTNGSSNSTLDNLDFITELITEVPLEDRISQGHALDNFILSCKISGTDCRKKEMWRAIWNWKYGNCYVFHVDKPLPTHVSTKAGDDYGLKVVLNTEESEYLPVYSQTVGAHIVIHDPSLMPFPETNGYMVAPGTSNNLALTKTTTSRVGGIYSPCYDTTVHDPIVSVFEEVYPWTNYSRAACQATCWQQMLIDSCNCHDAKYPSHGVAISPSNTTACTNEDPVNVACMDGTHVEYAQNTSCTHCLRPCQETAYHAAVTSGAWPARGYRHTLLRSFDQGLKVVQDLVNETTQISDNLIKVDIYYAELTYVDMSESIAYTTNQFMSDLGGAIGLWIGASVLSVAEVVEWLVDSGVLFSAKYCCKRSRNYAV